MCSNRPFPAVQSIRTPPKPSTSCLSHTLLLCFRADVHCRSHIGSTQAGGCVCVCVCFCDLIWMCMCSTPSFTHPSPPPSPPGQPPLPIPEGGRLCIHWNGRLRWQGVEEEWGWLSVVPGEEKGERERENGRGGGVCCLVFRIGAKRRRKRGADKQQRSWVDVRGCWLAGWRHSWLCLRREGVWIWANDNLCQSNNLRHFSCE